jgi:hypothetical protein
MRKCNKCGDVGEFRKKKNRNGNYCEISICWNCEREQKRNCENVRYKNLTQEQRIQHNNLAKIAQQKDSYKQWRRIWQKEREKDDLAYLLKRRIGALLRNGVFKNGKRTFDILGYTPEQFVIHMESLFEPWMSWDNWGMYNPNTWDDFDSSTWTWQIDHIKPISSFDIKTVEDPWLNKCWALENLRPFSSKENIFKSNKII